MQFQFVRWGLPFQIGVKFRKNPANWLWHLTDKLKQNEKQTLFYAKGLTLWYWLRSLSEIRISVRICKTLKLFKVGDSFQIPDWVTSFLCRTISTIVIANSEVVSQCVLCPQISPLLPTKAPQFSEITLTEINSSFNELLKRHTLLILCAKWFNSVTLILFNHCIVWIGVLGFIIYKVI